ncbi:MAG: glutamine synthetase, partial [Actinomycetota bacterium]
MDLDELTELVAVGEVDTVILAMTDMQGRLQGKRLDADAFLGDIAAHGAEACNYLLAVDMEMNTLPGFALTSWESGYGDFVLRPDLATLRRATWLEGTAICLADVEHHDGSPVV